MNRDIFIVDDARCVRYSLKLLLSKKGLHPMTFELPSVAMTSLSNRSDSPLLYLVDMRIPDELDGSENLFDYVCQHDLSPERFNFMTGHISEHDQEVLRRTGASVFEKPFSSDWIITYIEEVISKLDNHYPSVL